MIHTFHSYSSVWELDDADMLVQRSPQNDSNHPFLSYDKLGVAEKFVYAHVVYGKCLCIHYDRKSYVHPELDYWARTGELTFTTGKGKQKPINPLFTIGEKVECRNGQ